MTEEDLEKISRKFQALGSSRRLQILGLLHTRGVLSHGQLEDSMTSQVSEHLKVLERADLVERTRSGRFHMFRLNYEVLGEVLSSTGMFFSKEKDLKE